MSTHRGKAAAMVVLMLALAAFWLRPAGYEGSGFLPPCMFHRLTGFSCPGCGMTRATHAVLNGRLAEAMAFHPVGVVMLPILGGMVVFFLPSWVRRERVLPFHPIRAWFAWGALGAVLAFWFLRNLPLWPFRWLGPP